MTADGAARSLGRFGVWSNYDRLKILYSIDTVLYDDFGAFSQLRRNVCEVEADRVGAVLNDGPS